MATPKTITVLVSDDFRLKLIDQDISKRMEVKLTRIEAQRLADALLGFARGYGIVGRKALFSGEDITSR